MNPMQQIRGIANDLGEIMNIVTDQKLMEALTKQVDKLFAILDNPDWVCVPSDSWKVGMALLQSGTYHTLDDATRSACDALVAQNPYIAKPAAGDKS